MIDMSFLDLFKNNIITLYVMSHKDCSYPHCDYIKPIQVGTALHSPIPGFIRDNVGDNISDKNERYCEMTGQYWVWKNDSISNIVGFFHYRRYFSFKKYKEQPPSYVHIDSTYDLEREYGYDEKTLKRIIKKFDIIIPCPDNGIRCSNYELYARHHKSEDLDFVLDIIKRNYPEMYSNSVEYIQMHAGYYCNMFIMNKAIFNEYCIWVFTILREFDKSRSFKYYSVSDYRVTGYLGERLCGIYLYCLKKTNKYKILECPIVVVEHTEPLRILKTFDKTDCALVLAANDIYAPHLSALIESIVDNSCDNKNYDIVVLNTDISLTNQKIIKEQSINKPNISIRFVPMNTLIKKYSNLPTHGHFKIETYYRFFIQELMLDYNKVLYLDSDMIVNHDISELYAEDVGGFLVGACLDADSAGLYNGFEPTKKHYIDSVLKIEHPYLYFQAGTILFNLDEMRKKIDPRKMLNFALSNHWELLDQDVLNYFFQGNVKYLDMKWNCMVDMYNIRIKEIISKAPASLFEDYMKSRTNPFIIHYAGPQKPWQDKNMDFAEYYWKYLMKSPYYEISFTT